MCVVTDSSVLQDENDDDDDWNPCKAAGVCLMLLATCCEDDVVPHVLPFIKEHIKNPDWRYRDASIMAFGSILEGPELNQLKPLVVQVRLDAGRVNEVALGYQTCGPRPRSGPPKDDDGDYALQF